MKQIRRGVFETNSSSTHSICITKNNRNLLKVDHLHFALGNFGWEERRLTTPEEKASYLYTSVICMFDKETATKYTNKIYDMLLKSGIECSFEEPEWVQIGNYEYLDTGDIDHCGDDDHLAFIKKTIGNRRRLMRYLFSDESFILTGNDNEDSVVDITVDYPHEEFFKGN